MQPRLHIYGAAIATLAYTAMIPALNLIAICRRRKAAPRLWRQLRKPLFAAAVMGAAAWAIQRLGGRAWISLPAAVAIYAALTVLLRTVTAEDCALLPHGAAIARFLHLNVDSNGGKS